MLMLLIDGEILTSFDDFVLENRNTISQEEYEAVQRLNEGESVMIGHCSVERVQEGTYDEKEFMDWVDYHLSEGFYLPEGGKSVKDAVYQICKDYSTEMRITSAFESKSLNWKIVDKIVSQLSENSKIWHKAYTEEIRKKNLMKKWLLDE